ncbi:hypothetical protein WA158_002094 [Blastocystis sp. Blastoise]
MSQEHEPIHLFSPYTLRNCTFPNRLGIPPMCLFVSKDGEVNDIHVANYAKYAQLGFGCIIQEATAIVPEGRISSHCLGIWDDKFISGLKRIVDAVHFYGMKVGIQLHHAGRKASTLTHFESPPKAAIPLDQGGWNVVSSSSIPHDSTTRIPHQLTIPEIKLIIKQWGDAASRAVQSGYDFIEIHAAHGFLIDEFLSPICNNRTDEYGGSFENRIRILLEILEEVRSRIPVTMPIFVRISAMDWVQGGFDIQQSIRLSTLLVHNYEVDLMHISTGGVAYNQEIPKNWDFQLDVCKQIKQETDVPCACVGGICDGKIANDMITSGSADLVMIGRTVLRDSFIPRHVAQDLNIPGPDYAYYYKWATKKPSQSQY